MNRPQPPVIVVQQPGCNCLTLIAAVTSFIASVVTILAFFYKDSNSLLAGLSDFWADTFLEDIAPGAEDFFADIATFADANPWAAWVSAAVILVIFGVVGFGMMEDVYPDSCLQTAGLWLGCLVFALPVMLAWIWVFSGTISSLCLGGFVAVAFVLITGLILFLSDMIEF